MNNIKFLIIYNPTDYIQNYISITILYFYIWSKYIYS